MLRWTKTLLCTAVVLFSVAATAGCDGAAPEVTPGAAEAAPASGGSAKADPGEGAGTVDAAGRRYVDAVNAKDLDALAESFAEDGLVIDVSREIRGRDAIRGWADAEVIGGSLRVLEVTPMEGGQDLLVHWAPKGSDGWRAHYRFTYADDRIVKADLQYA
jgi:ketosteroid isomerase-like protein